MTRKILLPLLAAFALLLGVGTAPASANPPGNLAQPWTSWACKNFLGTTMISGVLAVHYNHGSDHSDDPYGTYWSITSVAYGVRTNGFVDTDIRYNGQTTWHYADTLIWSGLGNGGNTYINNMSRTANGGYARWVVTYYVSNGAGWDEASCTVAPHGWSTGEQYGAP